MRGGVWGAMPRGVGKWGMLMEWGGGERGRKDKKKWGKEQSVKQKPQIQGRIKQHFPSLVIHPRHLGLK